MKPKRRYGGVSVAIQPKLEGGTMTTIKSVTVYWDSQDPANEGWAYRASDDDGLIDSGALDADQTIGEAIEDAIAFTDIDATSDDFAVEPRADGGYAVWTAAN